MACSLEVSWKWWCNSRILLSVLVVYLALRGVEGESEAFRNLGVPKSVSIRGDGSSIQRPDSFSEGRFLKRRYKRDLEEIIRNKPIMYAPTIVQRVTESLLRLRDQLDTLEKYLLNPNNMTTPSPLVSTTTLSPNSTTTALPVSNNVTTTTVKPSTNITTTPVIKPSTNATTPKPKKTRINDKRGPPMDHRLFLPVVGNDASGIAHVRKKRQVRYEEINLRQDPPVLNITTTTGSNNTTTKATGTPNTTTTKATGTPNNTTTTTPVTPITNVTSTPVTNSTTTPVTNVTTTPVTNITTPVTNITSPVTNVTTTSPMSTTTITPNVTEPPIIPTKDEVVKTLWTVLASSEMVMVNQLSKDRVTELEGCSKTLDSINNYFYKIDLQNNTQTVLYWLVLAKLSTKHSIQRLAEQKQTFAYIEKLDDITSLITAGFCILALTFAIYMCYLGSRQRKPYVVNYHDYDSGTSYRIRNNNNNAQPTVGIRPLRQSSSIYSTPTGTSVTTRSNPLYSSQRSVDAERPTPDQMAAAGGLNNDDAPPKTETVRFEPMYVDKNEKNSALNRDRRLSQQPNVHAPDYRDPRRHRKTNLDQYRDNEGFVPDDVVIVRPNSESAL